MNVRDLDLSSLAKLPPYSVKEEHFKRSLIHDLTKASIRQQTDTMLVYASRGFHRTGLVPTQRFVRSVSNDRPSLHGRRYSVDVITNDWNSMTEDAELPKTLTAPLVPLEIDIEEMDAPIPRTPLSALPAPSRFWKLNRPQYHPPDNSNTYLELKKSSLANEDFRTILKYDTWESWFQDGILNVALELLCQRFDCKKNQIEITNSMVTQIVYQVGRDGDVDNNDFANYKEEKARFADKKWIFLPINDGIADGEYGGNGGTHWSFLVVNRIKGVAHFIDSYFMRVYKQRWIAFKVLEGIQNITGQGLEYSPEWYSPDQADNNRFKGDCGACGPFVFFMIKEFVTAIREAQKNELEDSLLFYLPQSYPMRFGRKFNSWDVRLEIFHIIARERMIHDAKPIADKHDHAALMGLEKTALVEFIHPSHPEFERVESEAASAGRVDEHMDEHDSSETAETEAGSDYEEANEDEDKGFEMEGMNDDHRQCRGSSMELEDDMSFLDDVDFEGSDGALDEVMDDALPSVQCVHFETETDAINDPALVIIEEPLEESNEVDIPSPHH